MDKYFVLYGASLVITVCISIIVSMCKKEDVVECFLRAYGAIIIYHVILLVGAVAGFDLIN